MKETPKEKAKQLIQKFELIDREQRYQDELNLFEAKQCALICVDEKFKSIEDSFGGNTKTTIRLMKLSKAYKELIEVKQEINRYE